jgi:hypothetical protein
MRRELRRGILRGQADTVDRPCLTCRVCEGEDCPRAITVVLFFFFFVHFRAPKSTELHVARPPAQFLLLLLPAILKSPL